MEDLKQRLIVVFDEFTMKKKIARLNNIIASGCMDDEARSPSSFKEDILLSRMVSVRNVANK